jgi:methionyl-tRNA formyltransferase
MTAPDLANVVLLGKGDLAIRVAEWFLDATDFDLVAVVPAIPEPSWTGSLTDFAVRRGVSLVDSGDFRDVDDDIRIDLAFSVFYDKIIKPEFINRCGRILNLHNGPLPAYRGVSPINWALRNGEDMHGATIHEISPGVDDGPIVSQVTYSIYPESDEVEDVLRRAYAYGWTLFEQTMPLLDRIVARPQDDAQASHYTRKDDERLGDRRGFRRDGAEGRSGTPTAEAPLPQ